MCGIIGIVGGEEVADRLVDGLRRMEYRGYDSAGVCTLHDGQLVRRRAPGKLTNLVRELARDPAPGVIGIAHTRWATHGAPTAANAHPHATDEVALVHNGIIENFRQLQEALGARGRTFESDTDSEVVAHLISEQVEAGLSPEEAVKLALPQLRGAFALAIAFRQHPDMLIGARLGSPLVVGYGEGETYLGSDALALAPLTQKISYLDEGDWVVITREGTRIFDRDNQPVERDIVASGASAAAIEKGNYRHFMQKEIFEQPTVVAQTLRSYVRQVDQSVALPQFDFDLDQDQPRHHRRLRHELLCGDGRQVLVRAVRAAAGRHRCRQRVPLSRSGARAGRAGAVHFADRRDRRYARRAAPLQGAGQTIAVVVNVPTSSMAREADLLLPTHAGPEIGVASTKAFTCQLAVLAALAAHMAVKRGVMSRAEEAEVVAHLLEAPASLNAALAHDDDIAAMAHLIAPARDVLYLGRGQDYPLALEGALKLKEISYIHAEGYAAGEMKHGPIALIDEAVPVIVLAPSGPLFEKTVSNMQEVRARGGKIVLISDAEGIAEAGEGCLATIEMPKVHPLIAPLVYAVPVQLLAYHVACVKGTDVDQPRNLAKSVTVE